MNCAWRSIRLPRRFQAPLRACSLRRRSRSPRLHLPGRRQRRRWRPRLRRQPLRVLLLRRLQRRRRRQPRQQSHPPHRAIRGRPSYPRRTNRRRSLQLGNTWRSPRPAKACCLSPPSSWRCLAWPATFICSSAPHNRQRRRLPLRISRPRHRPRLRWHPRKASPRLARHRLILLLRRPLPLRPLWSHPPPPRAHRPQVRPVRRPRVL